MKCSGKRHGCLGTVWRVAPVLIAMAGAAFAEEDSAWFLTVGGVNSYPHLRDASRQIEAEIEAPFTLVSPGHTPAKTFSDLRDDMGIWTPYLGIGRRLSPRWNAFAQMGYSVGTVASQGRSPSILAMPFVYDVRFQRTNFYMGTGLALYPWGTPERRRYASLIDRLAQARPFVGGALNWNFLTAKTKVDAGLGSVPDLVRIEDKKEWRALSSAISVGVNVPITANTSFSVAGQYLHFFKYGEDFSGPGINVYWRWFFGRSKGTPEARFEDSTR